MGRAKRHHVVPVGYLRGWSPAGDQRRVKVRLVPNDAPKLLGLRDVCVRDHWNSRVLDDGTRDVGIEVLLADNVEGQALPLLRRLAEEGSVPSADQRLLVAALLASIVVRGLTLRDQLITTGVDIGEQYLLDNPGAEPAVRHEQSRHRDGTRAVETAFETMWPLIVSWLGSMRWQVVDAPAADLATSDQPLLSYNASTGRTVGSFLTRGSIDAVLFALTPSRLLLASWQCGPDEGGLTAPEHLVAWFNRQQRRHAKRHFIEPPDTRPPLYDEDDRLRSTWTRDDERLDAAWSAVEATQASESSIAFAVPSQSGGYALWQSPPAAE